MSEDEEAKAVARVKAASVLGDIDRMEAHLVRPHSVAMRWTALINLVVLFLSSRIVEGDLLHPLMLVQYVLMGVASVGIWARRRSADRRIEGRLGHDHEA